MEVEDCATPHHEAPTSSELFADRLCGVSCSGDEKAGFWRDSRRRLTEVGFVGVWGNWVM